MTSLPSLGNRPRPTTSARRKPLPRPARYRPLLETLEERTLLAAAFLAPPPQVVTFTALTAFAGTGRDASQAINDFLRSAPAHSVVELPPGVYTVKHPIVVPKPLTLTTQGLENAPKCNFTGDTGCAEILADPEFEGAPGLLYSDQDGVRIDHLVFDGNKNLRTGANVQRCRDGDSLYGVNLFLRGSFAVTNSVSRNALCGSGLCVPGVSHDIQIVNNTFAFNGVHNGLFADGLSIEDGVRAEVLDNEFIDGGTDVTLILGGGRDCKIQGNVFRYGPSFSGGAFAALMLHAWPYSSGDYTGADVSGNVIDGGPNRRAGFGLLIGSAPWYPSNPHGAHVHDNTITNVQMGLSVDRGTGIQLDHNTVTNSGGGLTYTVFGRRPTSAYNISPTSQVDLSADPDPGKYTHTTLAGNIPNWLNSPEAATEDGNLDLRDYFTNLYVGYAGRLPGPGEVAWWVSHAEGMSLPGLFQAFIRSPEVRQHAGPAAGQDVRPGSLPVRGDLVEVLVAQALAAQSAESTLAPGLGSPPPASGADPLGAAEERGTLETGGERAVIAGLIAAAEGKTIWVAGVNRTSSPRGPEPGGGDDGVAVLDEALGAPVSGRNADRLFN
jgi:hypothetical protein